MRFLMLEQLLEIWSCSVTFSRRIRLTISSYSRISSRSLVTLLIHSS